MKTAWHIIQITMLMGLAAWWAGCQRGPAIADGDPSMATAGVMGTESMGEPPPDIPPYEGELVLGVEVIGVPAGGPWLDVARFSLREWCAFLSLASEIDVELERASDSRVQYGTLKQSIDACVANNGGSSRDSSGRKRDGDVKWCTDKLAPELQIVRVDAPTPEEISVSVKSFAHRLDQCLNGSVYYLTFSEILSIKDMELQAKDAYLDTFPDPSLTEKCIFSKVLPSHFDDAELEAKVVSVLDSCKVVAENQNEWTDRDTMVLECAENLSTPEQIAKVEDLWGWRQVVDECVGGSRVAAEQRLKMGDPVPTDG